MTERSASGLVLENVRISLKGRILVDLSLGVAPGRVATVMGPSGSGKSTLLAYVGGFLEPAFTAEGTVLLNGTDITRLAAHRRHVGILFQDDLLFPHLSVAGNLAFALPERVRGRAARRQRVEDALIEIGLEAHGERDPATLSGGQRARVALMRVLLSEPHALLLDEPFSKLDATLRAQIRDLVFAKARERELPVLLVTHDPADAEAAGNHVVSLSSP
ncbi:putative thiamine transport system ATP-binding protein [Rhodobium orientis]|uniref:ABC transporter ATP-binding protein n=1 Tax=Rhodobium orientis TaxID=34017 RepID=A0A327JL25_9HYPH|nr:ATP-binding cassette domain-containing protein [Rhodobium orientis]MBB4302030.1 putative thiamine transport system ATP-binding protein [Rhodobium orientis]MBK5950267.1 ABC transporter ATP-binding protein [Rhodobium orientis]RAI27140.1 ABC transporter ATP-binding protein [Rhodobium orientis]